MYNKQIDYTLLWIEDKKSIITTMYNNMHADLSVGYDVCGSCIKSQIEQITRYTADYECELMELADRKNPNYWCYLDMVRRGTIEE